MTHDVNTVQSTLTLPADPEPTSLRLTLIGILFGGVVVGYLLTFLIFPNSSGCSPLSLIVGVIIGALLMQGAEIYLKPRWDSKTALELSPQQLNIRKRDRELQAINPENQPRMHMWRFEVKRAGRVPKGWWVVGLAIEDNDIYLPVYTLMSPEQLEILPYGEHFTPLISRDEIKRVDGDMMRLSGVQRRLLKAEASRDLHGIEIEYDNLLVYIDWMKVHFPEWLPND